MELLSPGARGRPDRHQTMRATMDWSHDLLTADEQRLFRRLSVFAGGFVLDAAEEVAAHDLPAPVELVEALVSKSLIDVDRQRAEPRLRLLEPVRQYAAEKLRGAGELESVEGRHLDWVVHFARRVGRGFEETRAPGPGG
jgi:non-specific serine/threonine protein kinase